MIRRCVPPRVLRFASLAPQAMFGSAWGHAARVG